MGNVWSDCQNCGMSYVECSARGVLGTRCCSDCKHVKW